ncbi:MAG TPA: ATP-binding protein [Hanamia sp.]|nr:ATP-binding protein [Hanamia sp.]
MLITLKTKIWFTVFSIVLMFTFFTLYYFPSQQRQLLLKNYNTEIQNLANTVALGVRIALTEQNFDGLDSAMKFVTDDPRLQFVSAVQFDTLWSKDHRQFKIEKTIFKTFPENEHPAPDVQSNNAIIVKRGTFNSSIMSGEILLAFSTKKINESQAEIKRTSLMVSGFVLFVGLLLGLWFSRKISRPVLALCDAANKVGEGNLDQRVKKISNDEIGQLGKAFNHMVDDLSRTRQALSKNNEALSATNTQLNNTVLELKSTQAQLIQSEKMASLGELTAGIAHEIQNPLNFVNNFSEVNTELIEEMKEELMAGNHKDACSIAENIKENQQKITQHGKRADAIVKGMLQHSRPSTGQKQPTEINDLANEYLRLSYHGLRAKDKSFNATIITDFDPQIGKINVIPQDTGRVLLNLYNNAFYTVTKKKELNLPGYEPTVSVTTKMIELPSGEREAEIIVKDNGTGISSKIIDKIFHPFFTTKPAGEGTGLGLSLSYDIIKAQGGTIEVETTEGEGSVFMILLH